VFPVIAGSTVGIGKVISVERVFRGSACMQDSVAKYFKKAIVFFEAIETPRM